MKYISIDDEHGIFECGNHKFPAYLVGWSDFYVGDAKAYNRAVQVPLGETGLKMSIIWSTWSHSSNNQKFGTGEPDLVEIALLDEEGGFIWDDSVRGYMNEEDVQKAIAQANKQAKEQS